MAQSSAWLENVVYQAVDDRYAVISTLWDEMNWVHITDSTHASAGVVRHANDQSLWVSQHAAGANMSVDVNPGQCVVCVLGDQRGSYMGILDSVKNLVVTASDPLLGRIDSIYAVITDETFGEATSKFEVVYVQGTPAVSPVVPTAPSSYAILLGNITVGAAVTQINAANLSDQRHQISPKMCTGIFLNSAPTNTVNGSHFYNLVNNSLNWVFNSHVTPLATASGNTWNTYTPTLTASTSNPTLGTGSSVAGEWRYLDNGDWVMAQGKIIFGTSGVAVGSGTYRVSLPVTPGQINPGAVNKMDCAGTIMLVDASTGNHLVGELHVADNNPSTIMEITNLTASTASFVTNAFPWVWAASDEMYWSVIYPVNDVSV